MRSISATEMVNSPATTTPLFSTRSSTSHRETCRVSSKASSDGWVDRFARLLSTDIDTRFHAAGLVKGLSQLCQPEKALNLPPTIDNRHFPSLKTPLKLPAHVRFPAIQGRTQRAITGGRDEVEKKSRQTDT